MAVEAKAGTLIAIVLGEALGGRSRELLDIR